MCSSWVAWSVTRLKRKACFGLKTEAGCWRSCRQKFLLPGALRFLLFYVSAKCPIFLHYPNDPICVCFLFCFVPATCSDFLCVDAIYCLLSVAKCALRTFEWLAKKKLEYLPGFEFEKIFLCSKCPLFCSKKCRLFVKCLQSLLPACAAPLNYFASLYSHRACPVAVYSLRLALSTAAPLPACCSVAPSL